MKAAEAMRPHNSEEDLQLELGTFLFFALDSAQVLPQLADSCY